FCASSFMRCSSVFNLSTCLASSDFALSFKVLSPFCSFDWASVIAFCLSSNSFWRLLSSPMNFSCAFLPSVFSVTALWKSTTATRPPPWAPPLGGGVCASSPAGNANPANATKLSFFISPSSLESSSNCKFEVVRLLINREGQACGLAIKQAMDAVRIECKNQPERCIDDRHHNLKFNSHAASDPRVCARKESYLFGSELTFAVEDLPSQLIFFENPRISDVYEWRHGKHASDDWNAIFDVQQTLRIAA